MGIRTPEQIENLRKMLSITMSPGFVFASDAEINAIADAIQEEVDRQPIPWQIKVRHSNSPESWDDIPFEPKQIVASTKLLKAACERLLAKFSAIIEIRVYEKGKTEHHFALARENNIDCNEKETQ